MVVAALAALYPRAISPAWRWSAGWCTRGPGGLRPRPMDTAAASPFAGSTSSKAERVSQRHTHKDRGHTEDAEATGYTGCCAEGTALNCSLV